MFPNFGDFVCHESAHLAAIDQPRTVGILLRLESLLDIWDVLEKVKFNFFEF
jgi:hypothetical protein